MKWISDDRSDEDINTDEIKNLFDLQTLAGQVMGEDGLEYLNSGSDDQKTLRANTSAFDGIQIRPRRLIDVQNISTSISLFGQELGNPILLSPVGFQRFFHPDGEIASAKAAQLKGHQMIASTVSNYSVKEIVEASGHVPWFQLYPTPNRTITKKLLDQASEAGCEVCVLTVDTPVIGNRENHGTTLVKLVDEGKLEMGNFKGILPSGVQFTDASATWEIIDWLKANCEMKIVLKGIVTHEDAALAKKYGADGIIVSNHGGRQLESNRATIDCLPEVVEEINGAMPVLLDGGIRRGTHVFKALALGANAVCIGRPYCWGLGALGQKGVEMALDILMKEFVMDMQLAGTPSIADITKDFVLSK